MRLTVVGCGTAAPDGERVCSGYFVEATGVRLLLDCGPGVVHGMARLALPWPDITHVALSHFHNDHIGDVPMLLFALKHGLRQPRERPLTVYGPKGTRKRFDKLADALGEHVTEPGFELRIEELDPGAARALNDTIRITAGAVNHAQPALAWRVESAVGSLGYSGDTGPSEAAANFLQHADTVICECALPDDEALDAHLTPTTLAAMARAMLPRRLVVTHVYPQLDRHALPALLHEHGWDGEVVVARDGMRLDIPA